MDIVALSVEVFGAGSLVAALIKNKMVKRKAAQVRDYTKYLKALLSAKSPAI